MFQGVYILTTTDKFTVPAGLSARDTDLCKRALETLAFNTYSDVGYPWSPYRCVSPGKGRFDGIWNWDSAFHAMGYARFDTELAKDSIIGFLKFQQNNGILPDVIFETGEVISSYCKPPFFAYAVLRIYENSGDRAFLSEMYPKLVMNAEYFENHRRYDGLFYYDSDDKDSLDYETHVRWESGWDNSVRWDGGITNKWAIDLNCYMVIFYNSLSKIADILGKISDSHEYTTRAGNLSQLINEKMWDSKNSIYSDTDRFTGEPSGVLTPASFMPLYAGIAPNDRACAMDRAARTRMRGRMPTVSFDDPGYSNDYWRGPTWLNVAYFAAKGLHDYGFDTGEIIKEYILDMCHAEKKGICENYDSLTGEGLCCDHFSWSSVFILEFILGFDS